jgi:cytochrome c peroxidase
MSRLRVTLLLPIAALLVGCAEREVSSPELPSFAVTGVPLTSIEELGKSIFFDRTLSSNNNQSCAVCHDSKVGFTGPIAGINLHGAVYRGSVPTRFGNRKPPSAAYATQSPVFYFDDEEGLFIGGNFWDGRATGEALGNPAADQALGPFLNPVEQNNASKQDVLEKVAGSKYAGLWEAVWGEPISWETFELIQMNYDRIGLAVAAYEGSAEVNAFTSKYDAVVAGVEEFTEQEAFGLELSRAEGKAMCGACHVFENDDGSLMESALFTDFSFDNPGVPGRRQPDQSRGRQLDRSGPGRFSGESAEPGLGRNGRREYGEAQGADPAQRGQGSGQGFPQGLHAQWRLQVVGRGRALLQHARCGGLARS